MCKEGLVKSLASMNNIGMRSLTVMLNSVAVCPQLCHNVLASLSDFYHLPLYTSMALQESNFQGINIPNTSTPHRDLHISRMYAVHLWIADQIASSSCVERSLQG